MYLCDGLDENDGQDGQQLAELGVDDPAHLGVPPSAFHYQTVDVSAFSRRRSETRQRTQSESSTLDCLLLLKLFSSCITKCIFLRFFWNLDRLLFKYFCIDW